MEGIFSILVADASEKVMGNVAKLLEAEAVPVENSPEKARPNSLSIFLNKIPTKPDIELDENLLDNDEDVTDSNLETVEKEVRQAGS